MNHRRVRKLVKLPGGPYNKIPRGAFMPKRLNASSWVRGQIKACFNLFFTSSSPPTSSQESTDKSWRWRVLIQRVTRDSQYTDRKFMTQSDPSLKTNQYTVYIQVFMVAENKVLYRNRIFLILFDSQVLLYFEHNADKGSSCP